MPDVIKGDGTIEPFRPEKLIESLEHSGTDAPLAKRIAQTISLSVKEGMTTTEIYRNAFALLKKEERTLAARYSMRRAILDLGPTGFPFEDYVSALMRAKGYQTKTRIMLQGKCAEHEVDILLTKDSKTYGAELKFHNTPGFKTDIKTALYVRARFTDIQAYKGERGAQAEVQEGWLITNTKFTDNAISYAMCSGIRLLGWDYPDKGNLSEMIEETRLYPVTVLTTLTQKEKMQLLAGGTVLCESLVSDPSSLSRIGIPVKKHAGVLAECKKLCEMAQ